MFRRCPRAVQYIPASERRQAFEEFCKAAGTSRAKAAGGRAAAGGGAHGSGGSAAAGKGAQEEGGGPQPAEAGFEALLHEIQEACGGAAAVGAGGGSVNGASEGRGDAKGSGSGSGPLLRWGEWLSLEQLEPMWGSDPRWRRCRAEARQRLFDSRIEPLRAAAKKAREEGFRWVGGGGVGGGSLHAVCVLDGGRQVCGMHRPVLTWGQEAHGGVSCSTADSTALAGSSRAHRRARCCTWHSWQPAPTNLPTHTHPPLFPGRC